MSIRVSSAQYPVTLQWNVLQPVNASLEIGTRIVSLTTEGSAHIISSDEAIKLMVNGIKESPKNFALEQAYPNPFNPSTTIRYSIPEESKVSITVYNLLGQVVGRLIDAIESSGYKSVEWNASDIAGGVYFYKLEATSLTDPTKTFHQVRKTLLVK